METFEPMSTGRIIDKSFRLYKSHFLRFITIVALIQIPVSILSLASEMMIHHGTRSSTASSESDLFTDPEMENLGTELNEEIGDTPFGGEVDLYEDSSDFGAAMVFGIAGMGILAILAILGQLLSQGALAKSVSEVYLGKEISVKEAYKAVLPKIWVLIGAGILIGLIVMFGFMILVVPGIIFGLWFALSTQVIVLENEGVTGGMSRSRNLVKGNLGKVFAVGFLAGIIAWIISMIVSFPAQMGAGLLQPHSFFLARFIAMIGQIAGNTLAVPISAAAYILLYYDLRIRKEGFDLEMLAENLETTAE